MLICISGGFIQPFFLTSEVNLAFQNGGKIKFYGIVFLNPFAQPHAGTAAVKCSITPTHTKSEMNQG